MGDDAGESANPSTGDAQGTAPLKRLTRTQYVRTVRDLVGVDVLKLNTVLPADGLAGPFTSNATSPLTMLAVTQYLEAANQIAAAADVRALSGCSDDSCGEAFAKKLAAKAFRRPLNKEDESSILSVYAAGRAGGDVEHALRVSLAAMLQAPSFLYHVELGEGTGKRIPLTPHEIANRLSYFFTNGAPDEKLVAAADEGKLSDRSEVRRQAERLFLAPAVRDQLGLFHREWLGLSGLGGLSKDPDRYPFFAEDPDGVRSAMREELTSFVDFVIRYAQGDLRALMTAPLAFPSGPLFRIYGIDQPSDYDRSKPIGLDPAQRGGLMTMPAVLATHAHDKVTSPVHRGLFVFRNLLCLDMGPPPPDVVPSPIPEAEPGSTRREVFALHESDPKCAFCHKVIDPLGFMFEHYDAVGAYRTFDVDEQLAVDAKVKVAMNSELDGDVDGALPFAAKLPDSPVFQRCVVRQWFRFANGREDQPEDEPAIASLTKAFVESNFNMRELLLNVATSDAFLTRPGAAK